MSDETQSNVELDVLDEPADVATVHGQDAGLVEAEEPPDEPLDVPADFVTANERSDAESDDPPAILGGGVTPRG